MAGGYEPARDEFIELSRHFNLIPVWREVVADLETPVSAFRKLDEGRFSYLLESVEGGENLGRYSFLGKTAFLTFRSRGNRVEVAGADGCREFIAADPIDSLKQVVGRYNSPDVPDLPRFYGGAVGYISYDAVRFIEGLPDKNPDPLGLPELYFIFTDVVLVFDHVKHKIKVVVNARTEEDPDRAALIYDRALESIDEVVASLEKATSIRPLALTDATGAPGRGAGNGSLVQELPYPSHFRSNLSKGSFVEAVTRAKEYIAAGDIFQVVLSQRFSVAVEAEPFDIYRVLRTINPSPYMYYLNFGDLHIAGSSPEVMVRVEDGVAELRPIAGTRPRGGDRSEDERLARELLLDEKEKAEHIMLVDLGRNDLGRACEFGSVDVDELMVVERYSHVMHMVSNVQGRLLPGKDQFDVLRATFPAGTVSGSPKIRAMEIIDELEPARRGPYAGAIGYFSFSGNMDTCITIRTIVLCDGEAHIQAGAGIVADSDPEREYHETVNKAKALMKAVLETPVSRERATSSPGSP